MSRTRVWKPVETWIPRYIQTRPTQALLATCVEDRAARWRDEKPYRGGVPSLTAAISGEVQITFSDVVPALPLIRDHRLIAIATTGARRSGVLPDVPTLAESGLKGFNITAWVGLVAPKGTPKEIVDKLNGEIGRILKDPEFVKEITSIGIDPLGSTPAEFATFLRAEIPRWQQIVIDAGAKVE